MKESNLSPKGNLEDLVDLQVILWFQVEERLHDWLWGHAMDKWMKKCTKYGWPSNSVPGILGHVPVPRIFLGHFQLRSQDNKPQHMTQITNSVMRSARRPCQPKIDKSSWQMATCQQQFQLSTLSIWLRHYTQHLTQLIQYRNALKYSILNCASIDVYWKILQIISVYTWQKIL